jgi:hypothetical protein
MIRRPTNRAAAALGAKILHRSTPDVLCELGAGYPASCKWHEPA